MPSLARPPSASTPPPAVRHGTAKLRLFIGTDQYAIMRAEPILGARSRGWVIQKRTADGPASPAYCVLRAYGSLTCTCPDFEHRASRCKHIGALVACGLVSGRKGGSR